ncbi:MAG: glutamine amidotransferase [Isosphaeraceae bacterium]
MGSRLTFDQGHGLLTVLAVILLAFGLATLGYRRSFAQVPARRWYQLLTLRFVSIGIVGLLLFEPVLRVEGEVQSRRAVVFVLDRSASMAIVDDPTGVSRFDQARQQLLDWSARLDSEFTTRWIEFSDQAATLGRSGDLTRLVADGPSSSITRGLAAAARGVPNGAELEAILLLSDGIHNAGGDPIVEARRVGVPVHTITVGNSLTKSPTYRDLIVADLTLAERLPVNNTARATARLSHRGLGGRVVHAILEQDGQAVARTEVELKPGEAASEASFEFVPTAKGRHAYRVVVDRLPDETIAENNHRTVVSQVIDARIRVLYVEGALRAEYGALVQRFFSRDPDIEFCALVRTRPGVFLSRTNRPGLELKGIPTDRAILSTFDVLLIGDLDSGDWPPGALEAIAARVRDGAGLLMMGGYHSLGPGGYATSPVAPILPVELGTREVGQSTDRFLPRLTPAGRSHPIFTNIAGFFPTLDAPPARAGLPELDGCVKVAGTRAGATVLALGPGKPDFPALAIQLVGKGRTAVFTGDTTRNWQQAPRMMDQESPFLRFWGQMIRWLGNRSDVPFQGPGIVARAEKAYYDLGLPIVVEAIARNKEGEGISNASVKAEAAGPGKPLPEQSLSPVDGAPGAYRTTFEPDSPGGYTFRVTAEVEGTSYEAEPIDVEVGRASLEYDELDVNERLLLRIAEATGGQHRHLSAAGNLVDELSRQAHRRRNTWEQPLTWPPLFWALLVGSIGIEWLVRQRDQLR